mmetsp:Transcript_18340/g.28584  ORF Transcript_18340/g.28584 Transcript_18340/m.28584 type:complete len:90 (-) Transcript_18340:79-348(-)
MGAALLAGLHVNSRSPSENPKPMIPKHSSQNIRNQQYDVLQMWHLEAQLIGVLTSNLTPWTLNSASYNMNCPLRYQTRKRPLVLFGFRC